MTQAISIWGEWSKLSTIQRVERVTVISAAVLLALSAIAITTLYFTSGTHILSKPVFIAPLATLVGAHIIGILICEILKKTRQHSLQNMIGNAVQQAQQETPENSKQQPLQKNGYQWMCQACREGDMEALKVLIQAQIPLNMIHANDLRNLFSWRKGGQGRTCFFDDTPRIDYDLKEPYGGELAYLRQNPNELEKFRDDVDKKEVLPLLDIVLVKGSFQQIKGADNPLCLALENGHLALAEELLKAGASPNVRGQDGESPLHVAVRLGNLEGIALLIKYQARFDTLDEYFNTPLHTLFMKTAPEHCLECLKKLMESPQFDPILMEKPNFHGYTPYQYLAHNETLAEEALPHMIRGKINPVKVLGVASEEQVLKLLDEAIETAALTPPEDIEASNRFYTVYSLCLLFMRRRLTAPLCKCVEQFAALGGEGKVLYRSLVEGGHAQALELLIGDDLSDFVSLSQETTVYYLEDTNKKSEVIRYSLFHLAVKEKQIDVVKLLIEKGCDRTVRDSKQQTPLDIARKKGFQEIVQILST